MTYRCGATFAWQSDYTQFYLLDAVDSLYVPPVDITPEMMERSWHALHSGLVIYTGDCLQQLIDIQIYGAPAAAAPTEWRSGKAWTRIEMASAKFPSRRFTLSSPSQSSTEYGPTFQVDASAMTVRISWMEFVGSRDDSGLVEPDVICVQLWP